MKPRLAFATSTIIAATFGGPATAPAETFIGQNFTASRSDLDPPLRPDLSGAAGADYFVELSGGRYGVYRKSDGARVQTSVIEQFWIDAGVPPLPERAFDPRILYDDSARRWYALCADGFTPGQPSPGPNNFLFAISNSSDPTAGWTGFKIDSDSNDDRWADLPTIGFNKDVVTLSANMYNLGTSNPPSTPTLVVIPKTSLLAPVPSISGSSKFEELPIAGTGFTIQPAVDMDNGSLPLPLLARSNLSSLKRSSVTGTPASPSISTTGGLIAISANTDPPAADQPGTTTKLNTGFDTRFWSSVVRNNGELWAIHTVGLNGRAALRWYRINESTNAVIESGHIADASLAYCFSSIAVNDFGDVVIGMSGSSLSTFPSSFAVVGKTVGGVTTFSAPFMTKEGVSYYAPGNNRWGDYSATTLDPADPSIFWTFQEYVHATNERSRQVTEIIIPQAGEVRWKDAGDGSFSSAANWLGSTAPSQTDHVIYSRATDPLGQGYAVTLDANHTVDRISFRQGRATLDLGGNTLTAASTSPSKPGITIGEFGGGPHVTLTNGTIVGDDLLLAPSPQSSAILNLNGANVQISCDGIGGTPDQPGGSAVLNVDFNSTLNVTSLTRIWPGGVLNFNKGQVNAGNLDVIGGRVNAASAGGEKVLRTSDVQTSNGGRVDLTTNAMTIDYAPAAASPLAGVLAQINSAYAAGAWTGPGIASSSADAATHGLGYAEASQLGAIPPIFGSVDSSTVLVRYTRYGDANLDGIADIGDFSLLAASFNTPGFWNRGDFTYDGNVDIADFALLASNFNQSATRRAETVPEPGALAAIAGAMLLVLRRGRG